MNNIILLCKKCRNYKEKANGKGSWLCFKHLVMTITKKNK